MYPALAVAAQFAEADEVVFVGTPQGVESRLVPEAGLEFRPLQARGFDRARPLSLLTSTLQIAESTVVARQWVSRMRPDVVVGFGGYVSIPVGLAAVLCRVPLVLHEQNSVPGLANRFLSRWAASVAVTYPRSATMFRHRERVAVTGNPVRRAVLDSDRARGRKSLGIAEDALVLLAFGGSRGAKHLNSALAGLRDRLGTVPKLEVLQVAGPSDAERVRGLLGDQPGAERDVRWRVLDYLDDMGSALAASDVVVARAGATSLAEITAIGVPAVLVPYPYATDDHQTKNAEALLQSGAAEVVRDSDLDGPVFGDTLVRILTDAPARATMSAASRLLGRPDAAERVARVIRLASEGYAAPDATSTEEPLA